ncbi:MAG: hypothetical protein AAGC85_11540 [Bacteroidota bacterium]
MLLIKPIEKKAIIGWILLAVLLIFLAFVKPTISKPVARGQIFMDKEVPKVVYPSYEDLNANQSTLTLTSKKEDEVPSDAHI